MWRKRSSRLASKAAQESSFLFEMALPHSLLLYCSALAAEQSLETQVSTLAGSGVKLAVKRDESDHVSFVFSDSSKEDLFNLAEGRWSCSIRDFVSEDSSIEPREDDLIPVLDGLDFRREDFDVVDEMPPDEAMEQEGEETEENYVESAIAGRYHSKGEVEKILEGISIVCKLCQRTFECARSLQRHVAIKHKMSAQLYENAEENIEAAKPEKRSRAKRTTTSKEGTDEAENAETKARVTCSICSLKFSSLSSCRRHVLQKHKDHKNKDAVLKALEASKLKTCKRVCSSISLRCFVCGEDCPGMRIFRHLKMWHADLENLDDVLKSARQQYNQMKNNSTKTGKSATLVKCPHCAKEMKSASIHCHMKFRCKENAQRRKLYECALCGFGSVFEDAYLEHKKSHGEPGQKDYTCCNCGKMFRSKAGLHMHQRKHHGFVMKVPLARYNCDRCEKTYTERTRYEKHMRSRHSGEQEEPSVCKGEVKSERCDPCVWMQEGDAASGKDHQSKEEIVVLIDTQYDSLHVQDDLEQQDASRALLPQGNQDVEQEDLYAQTFVVDEAALNSFIEDKNKWAVLEEVVLEGSEQHKTHVG